MSVSVEWEGKVRRVLHIRVQAWASGPVLWRKKYISTKSSGCERRLWVCKWLAGIAEPGCSRLEWMNEWNIASRYKNLAEFVQTIACIPNKLILSMSLSIQGFSSTPTIESSHSVIITQISWRRHSLRVFYRWYPRMVVIEMISRYCLVWLQPLPSPSALHLLSSSRVANEATHWMLNKQLTEHSRSFSGTQ